MSAALEGWAKSWLSEPRYISIFKPGVDVVKDYMCNVLVVIGSVVLAVNFLSSMGTGPVVCILKSVKSNNSSKDLGPYPNGATISMVNYANFHHNCIDGSMTKFMQYLPFILLLQAVSIILIEKMLMKFPRVSGKIERFYGTIVEESLFGKDPDVAEDVFDDKANSEAISRRRRRNEICMSLKRSDIIHTMYIFKNITEIFLLFIFIPANITFGLDAEKNKEPSTCIVELDEVPNLGLSEPGLVFYQCEGKKVHFFLMILYVQIATMAVVFICSFGSLFWCIFLRSVSKLLEKIERSSIDWDVDLEKVHGKDFLFLFDLLSHTSGIESTLRVLTHADDTFRRICLPKVQNDLDHIKVEEDKLKIIWYPAELERWLEGNSHKGIVVDSYDVTIFPAESINNSVTKLKAEKDKDGRYNAWFFDLQGGRTEYIITIACVIGKSRMKGERIVTTLLPFGPEKPRAGIVKSAATDEVEIAWEPPKGGFTKYVLGVDPNVTSSLPPRLGSRAGILAKNFYNISNGNIGSSGELGKISKDYTEREMSNLLTDHKISGLNPGESYGIELKTKTGSRFTRQPIFEVVMTKPQKVASFSVEAVATSQALLKWVAPEGHKRLKAYNLAIISSDNQLKREMAVKHNIDTAVNSYLLHNIPQGTEYSVTITSVCVFETMKTVSEVETLKFCTLPEPPLNLMLESRSPNSFTIKWDCPGVTHTTHRYKLSIEAPAIAYSSEYSVGGDKHTFNFSKLPDIVGTGEKYSVKIEYIVTPTGSDKEVTSAPLVGTFTTKPLAPTSFKLAPAEGENCISWVKSPTPSVSAYKIKIKSSEEGAKAEEFVIPSPEDVETTFCLYHLKDLVQGVHYKINIYAMVEDTELLPPVESKELHEKVILIDGGLSLYSEDMDKESVASGGLSRQVSIL